jgi:hypothetical protein
MLKSDSSSSTSIGSDPTPTPGASIANLPDVEDPVVVTSDSLPSVAEEIEGAAAEQPTQPEPPIEENKMTLGPLEPRTAMVGSDPGSALSGGLPSGLEGDDSWVPSAEDILESTTSHSKPLPALERLRRLTRGSMGNPQGTPETPGAGRRFAQRRMQQPFPHAQGGAGAGPTIAPPGVGMMDVFAVISQINEQLGLAQDLDVFLKVVVGVIKDLTQFHRVLVYQFDEMYNGQTVAELVDWSRTHDLYRGLHFPKGDIPQQARDLYMISMYFLILDAMIFIRLQIKFAFCMIVINLQPGLLSDLQMI